MINSLIRDNRERGSVGQFLKEHISQDSNLSIVSAYFTIYAYYQMKDQLDKIKSLNFLFGEPTFIKSLDPTKTNKKNYLIEDNNLIVPIDNRLIQKNIAKECADWISNNVEIKSMVKPNFLHGKMYHIAQNNGVQKAISGSSNFTVNGLGLGGKPNIELNLIVDSDRERADLKSWFDELWNDNTGLVEDVKETVLKYLEQLYIENEPEFIYYKTLFHIFADYISNQDSGGLLNQKTGFYNTVIWNILYRFQQDGVRGAINKILKHNGCIIADSVGLGKTFEALGVIKYFELLNERVLVLAPKKLKDNWTVYRQNDDRNILSKDQFNYDVLCHTDLGRASGKSGDMNLDTITWGNYGLVVIDESHNFRGNPMDKIKDDGSVVMNRAKWLMEKIIKSGVKTKVLLLSATPVNNNLKDLRNQIHLITEGRNDAMVESTQIKDIAQTLKNAQTQFTNWADKKKNPDRTTKKLLDRLDSSFFKLLDELTIARSRKHIVSFYLDSESEIGKFPARLKPISVYSKIDLKDRFHSYDQVNKIILQYKLSIFNPSAYILSASLKKYEELALSNGKAKFKQSDREHFLIGMMKVNFLKRLESFIESFEISMDRTIKKIEDLEKRINKYKSEKNADNQFELPEMDENEIEGNESEEDNELWQVGKKLKFDLADLDLDAWMKDLEQDRQALIQLYNYAVAVAPEQDGKLKDLKDLIEAKIKTPLNETNKKVIIFTAYSDTAQYLYNCMKDWAKNDLKINIALVSGSETKTSFGKADYFSILTNFSPKAKNREKMTSMPQEGEIDILIATDCISEGQNLQDCDYLVNYDIHWNPVRIIQRFGRIDRLGSTNTCIQLVNFWPTKDLDNYINLKERVEARMALVDLTATAEDNVLDSTDIEDLIEDDLKYRNKQLKRLQNEVLDLEDMNESISLTDFTLDDFRIELLNFIETNRQKLEDAPDGLYAIVPSPSGIHRELSDVKLSDNEREIIQPGVLYCLKQKEGNQTSTEINPLQPYFLVYIYDNGSVRYNYTNAKQILEIYRLLCSGKKQAYEDLCDIFNDETNQGQDMKKYSELLTKASKEIIHIYGKKSNQALIGNDRGAIIIPKSERVNDLEQFELVTWLVVK